MSRKNEKPLIPEGAFEIDLFHKQEIRKVFHANEWWYVVNDVVSVLLESTNPESYLKSLRSRDEGLKEGWSQIVTPLEIQTVGGPQKLSCVNVEGIFRIMQTVPSKKAEPFKKWLAKVGYERIQEYQNPEIGIKRAMLTYKVKGYSDEWINARVRTILSRKELTDEWQARAVQSTEYGILTDVISEKTFGLKTKAHKEYKGLAKAHSLRDHMTDIELILTMLGEKSTTEIARKTDALGFTANVKAAEAGGKIAGTARQNLEKQLGEPVVSRKNYLKIGNTNGTLELPSTPQDDPDKKPPEE